MGILVGAASAAMRRLDAGSVAWALAGSIAILGAGGAVDALVTRVPVFELDGEIDSSGDGNMGWGFRLPVIFSAGVLVWASSAALALSRIDSATPASPRLWQLLAGLFAFMGVDELITFHELVEDWTGLGGWQLPYLPVVVAAGWLWIRLLPLISRRQHALALWVGGAACWASSQLLEAVWHTGLGSELLEHLGVTAWYGLTVGEEILEMAGSSLFLVALLFLLSDLASAGVRRAPTAARLDHVAGWAASPQRSGPRSG
jgi:hypothetical protein